MVYLYLAVLITGIYFVLRILGPEMAKPPLPRKPTKSDLLKNPLANQPDQRIAKLETLLAEKNKNIVHLQTELKAFQIQLHEFDKVKTLLEEEVHRLKEQNQMFRSEFGIPSEQPKENSIT